MTGSTLSEAALHEAAHAVAALGHGINVLSIDLGGVRLGPPGDCLERGQHHGAVAAGYAVVALAGQAAAPGTGLSKSDELLLAHARFLGSWSDPPDVMLSAFTSIAERFVFDRREAIERLAAALDERRKLSGEEVGEICPEVRP